MIAKHWRVTPIDFACLRWLAEESGLSEAEYLRRLVRAPPPPAVWPECKPVADQIWTREHQQDVIDEAWSEEHPSGAASSGNWRKRRRTLWSTASCPAAC